LQLSFETDDDALLARHALWISKFHPQVFKAFPEYCQFDPTLALPPDVRKHAVRIFPRNAYRFGEEDVCGVATSLYRNDGTLEGSLINAAWKSPLLHAYLLYQLLTAPTLAVGIKYDAKNERVFVSIKKSGVEFDLGFWVTCIRNQIQSYDLESSLAGSGYVGLGFPLKTDLHAEFVADTLGNRRQNYSDDFFQRQVVNDWLIFHLKGEKVHRQSFKLDGKSRLSPANETPLGARLSTAQWMAAGTR
jgi:hypothetical protein